MKLENWIFFNIAMEVLFHFCLKVDLDLGNYERFLDIKLMRDNNITTGKIYQVSEFNWAWTGYHKVAARDYGLLNHLPPFVVW